MIITKLQGGLGNQLFQWAYGRALSIKHSTELCLDINYYNNQSGDTPRKYELNKFLYLRHNDCQPNSNPIFQVSDNFSYKELQYDNNYNYYLNGFWQSEKYFSDISELIKEELRPNNETLKKLSHHIKGKTVSLHIRRTDYVTSNGFHPVQTIEYYNKALEIIGNYDQLLIFSDDINWCKENLQYGNMIFIENQDNIEDMWLMSLCSDNIIANSSFSWWGAWLNKNNNKIVVAPNSWFGPHSNLNESDIVPSSWIKI